MRSVSTLGVVLATLSLFACGKASTPIVKDERNTQPAIAPAAATGAVVGASHVEQSRPSPPMLALLDHAVLRRLESQGFDLRSLSRRAQQAVSLEGERLGSGVNESHGWADNHTLALEPAYASLVRVIEADLRRHAEQDRAAGVGMAFSHRLFDARWLKSSAFHFELVAVVDRRDRRVYAPKTCGELRFIYRLAYEKWVRGQRVSSRVPMTVNVVFWLDPSRCEAHPQHPRRDTDPLQAVSWLMGYGETKASPRLKSIEVNLQTVRWPSTTRPNMAGHAEYLLRVFKPSADGEVLEVASLENTPDVDALRKHPARLRRLADWLLLPERENEIALGTLRVPEEYLATRAVSVAPHGLARRGNRPFSELLSTHWGSISPSRRRLLRRLDGLSCSGCHQSRSVAGFHLLGEDAPEQQLDRLALPHSPHFADELVRRETYMEALATGAVPSEYRAPAEHADGAGGWGARCGLDGGERSAYSDWRCAEGLTCLPTDGEEVGTCLSAIRATGDPCETGTTSWGPPRRDFTQLSPAADCGRDAVCETNAVGFPGGMCSSSCSGAPSDACGAIAILDEFNACLARGELFPGCLRTSVRPAALKACDGDHHCREDYVCAATETKGGVCIPPYFLFQLRVDGHGATP